MPTQCFFSSKSQAVPWMTPAVPLLSTMQVTTIPERSVYAALIGLPALGFVLARRRAKRS